MNEDCLELSALDNDAAFSLFILFLFSLVWDPVAEAPILRVLALLVTATPSSEYTGVSECTPSAVTNFSFVSSASIPNEMTPRK